ncbi:hypothetical protein CEXT_163871 [Caerostris extrusa]|uniref:Uncharacterized protein n=1 Tax=Caerostris extrusa TaxID=172846 RepID=A0AAV4U8S3_CAEEX|nr:hypothetical protein CEXT_163871 [Caerostris extrusa]
MHRRTDLSQNNVRSSRSRSDSKSFPFFCGERFYRQCGGFAAKGWRAEHHLGGIPKKIDQYIKCMAEDAHLGILSKARRGFYK